MPGFAYHVQGGPMKAQGPIKGLVAHQGASESRKHEGGHLRVLTELLPTEEREEVRSNKPLSVGEEAEGWLTGHWCHLLSLIFIRFLWLSHPGTPLLIALPPTHSSSP